MDAPETILPQNAWDDTHCRHVRCCGAVQCHSSRKLQSFSCSTFYNKATKKRIYYLCPIKQGTTPFHIWGDLVEKAGLKLDEIPKNWDGV